MVTVPFSVNLLALLARLSSACRSRIWSAWIVPRSGVAIDDDPIAVLRRHRLDRLGHVLDQRRQRERFEMKLHPPGLDLGEVEDVVDQREQVAARAEHAIERLDVLLQRLGILPQHLGDADDGVERRAQLVAHVGEELRLVLARHLRAGGSCPGFRRTAARSRSRSPPGRRRWRPARSACR